MVKIKATVDKQGLLKAINEFKELLHHNIEHVILHEALSELIDRIMVGFDSLSDRADALPEDPTNPSNWRQDFLDKLNDDLYDNTSINRGVITIKIGEKSFLGYDPSGKTNDPNDNSPLQWMVYYLEGLAGDWGFITPDIYERRRGQGSWEETWGRFGRGFMISREQFEEEGWDEIVSFEQIRHPFSGYAPVDIFAEAVREFRFKPYIEKALKAAAQGRKL